jgi:hypothetical protein
VDTGAEANFVDYYFVHDNRIPVVKLPRPIKLSFLDGNSPKTCITYSCALQIRIRDATYRIVAFLTPVDSRNPVVLSMPFVNKHIPNAVSAIDSFCGLVSPSSPVTAGSVSSCTAVPSLHDEEASYFWNSIPPCPGIVAFAATTISDPDAVFSDHRTGGEETDFPAISAAVEAEYQRRLDAHHRITASRAALDDYNNAVMEQYLSDKEDLLFSELIVHASAAATSAASPQEPLLPAIPSQYRDFADVFDVESAAPLNHSHGIQCEISNTSPLPPPATPFALSPQDNGEERKQIAPLLASGRISPSSSSTAAPSFFVNKHCRGCNQLKCTCGARDYPRRWCIDFRKLNACVPQDAYPVPSMPDLFHTVAGHRLYTKFDIDAAFWQVPVRPEHRHRTALICPSGFFEWNVMPFGYLNAPATFQRIMDKTLAPAREYCRAFMDDGII